MKRTLGFILTLLSLLLVGAAVSLVVDAASGKDTSDSIGGAVILIAFAAMSSFTAYRAFRPRNLAAAKLSRDDREKAALGLARSRGGKLTQAELALDTDMSIDEAKKLLDELVGKGAAELELKFLGGHGLLLSGSDLGR